MQRTLLVYCLACLLLAGSALLLAAEEEQGRQEPVSGVPIRYELPTAGPLPRTYRVTLAITLADNPDWIISQPVAGAVRTVTAENRGRFTDYWDGLDDNHMPVPPGTYGVKGIYMPARKWEITGEYHSVIPRLVVGAGDSWYPTAQEDDKLPWLYGAGFGYMAAVDVAPNGLAGFFHAYIENAVNPFLVDLNRPIGWSQVLKSYGSWGAAGGWSIATDGELVWCACSNGGIPFVYCADGRRFGSGRAVYRRDVYVPRGEPTDLAAWRDPATGKRYLYVAQEKDPDQRYPLYTQYAGGGEKRRVTLTEGNNIVVLEGETGEELGSVPLSHPRVLQVRGEELVALHLDEAGNWVVSATALQGGMPAPTWRRLLTAQGIAQPMGFAMDAAGNAYVSDLEANQVYKIDPQGRIVHRFGNGTRQRPGHYDERVFMSPGCLALWRDQQGQERLLVVELSGPNRISEWSLDGRLLRQWFASAYGADGGYCADPENPQHIYVPTCCPATGSGLVRYKVDYAKRTWTVDAVWPEVCSTGLSEEWGRFPGGSFRPKIINYHGHKYLAFARTHYDKYGYILYRQQGDDWVPSAGLIPVGSDDPQEPPHLRYFKTWYWWHDANGDGRLQEEEYRDRPAQLPAGTPYWGNTWLDDLSLTWMATGDTVWRIAPRSFDRFGNPIFHGEDWQVLLVDTILRARREGKATALFGGNELADGFPGDWQSIDGSLSEGFYVNFRGGIFDANYAPQYKISYYAPDGKGGFSMKWRVGRASQGRQRGSAQPGEIYGTIYITKPVNHILGVHDSTAGLYHLYTDDGLYVDTLFFDDHRFSPREKGGAYSLSGENFGGGHFLNQRNGKVYIAMTSNEPCALFEAEGWGARESPVRRLTKLQQSVTIRAAQIASPPELALKVRGGSGAARIARFLPAPGGPALDGSLAGWEGSEPIRFQADERQQVEVRCLYDPAHLYLRWHARLGREFVPQPLQPAERIFTHDRRADTLSFYVQGDPQAAPGGPPEGRRGDVRFVFGVFDDGGKPRPVALGMYPKWEGPGAGNPLTYGSAVAPAPFEHVALLDSVRLGYALDEDRQGLILAAAIPREAIPLLPPLDGSLRTMVNFEATFGGHTKFWWADSDGSASTITFDEPTEARLYPGSWAPAQFIGIEQLYVRAWSVIGPFGFPGMAELDHLTDRPRICERLATTAYPPEEKVDPQATYAGDITQTRVQARTLQWKTVSLTENRLDFGRELGWGYPDEGAAYAVTYLYSPQATQVSLRLEDGHGHHALRGWLNGQPLLAEKDKLDPKLLQYRIDTSAPVDLQAGWNELLLRFDHIWGDKSLGLRLEAPPEVLWQLRLAAKPPE